MGSCPGIRFDVTKYNKTSIREEKSSRNDGKEWAGESERWEVI